MRRRTVLGGLAASLTLRGATAQSPVTTMDLSAFPPERRAEIAAQHARMMAALPYERVTVAGSDAVAEWGRLRGAGRGWPVIVGGDEALERIADQFSIDDAALFGAPGGPPPRSPSAILKAADALRWPASLSTWEGGYSADELRAPVGDWPRAAPAVAPTVAADILTGKPFDRVHLLLLPTGASADAPAYLRWGGWNACPPPEHHVAALRSWNRRYGAELLGINGDTLNVRVRRRPASRDEALALAREHYRYCPDIVDQGVETLSALAASLMAGDDWFFWWD